SPPTAVSPWKPCCRSVCSTGSRGPTSVRARKAVLALVALGLLASCAKKPVNAPAPGSTAPRFDDFIFPVAAAGLAPAAIVDRHYAAWQILQSGDAKAAERD